MLSTGVDTRKGVFHRFLRCTHDMNALALRRSRCGSFWCGQCIHRCGKFCGKGRKPEVGAVQYASQGGRIGSGKTQQERPFVRLWEVVPKRSRRQEALRRLAWGVVEAVLLREARRIRGATRISSD